MHRLSRVLNYFSPAGIIAGGVIGMCLAVFVFNPSFWGFAGFIFGGALVVGFLAKVVPAIWFALRR